MCDFEKDVMKRMRDLALGKIKDGMKGVIGLDLSTVATGTWIVCSEMDKGSLINPKKSLPVEKRIDQIVNGIEITINQIRPSLVVIEKTILGHSNHGSLILSELGGIIRHYLRQKSIQYIEVYPTTLKKYILSGNSSKLDIMHEILVQYDVDISNDNVADAFVLSRIGLAYLYPEFNDSLSKSQKEVIETIKEKGEK